MLFDREREHEERKNVRKKKSGTDRKGVASWLHEERTEKRRQRRGDCGTGAREKRDA
jgi:hypothetical protein